MDRKRVNEKSRNEAVNDRILWSEEEVEQLMDLWTVVPADLIALAALLGRTVEACRQKHWEVVNRPAKQAAKVQVKELGTWSEGFTSLADMGY